MFWYILLAIVFLVFGFLLYSFGALQILITLFCSIPITKRALRDGCAINKQRINKMFMMTITLWITIIAIAAFLIIYFGNNWVKYGFLSGIIFAFLTSLGKLGINGANVLDYIKVYGKLYPQECFDESGFFSKLLSSL